MVTMSFMLKARLLCIEYLWVHSIAKSGFIERARALIVLMQV